MAIQDFKDGKDVPDKGDFGIMYLTKKWLEEHFIQATKVESGIVNNSKVIYVDVEGNVELDTFNLEDARNIPDYIKFRNVSGKFILGNNK